MKAVRRSNVAAGMIMLNVTWRDIYIKKKKLSEAIIFAVGQPRSSGPTNEYVS